MELDIELLRKIGVFAVSGISGMLFAYYRKWSFDVLKRTLFAYIFGDGHAVGRAITTLLAMCAGAGGLEYLDTLTLNQIIIAGAGIGLLVPQAVENKGK